MSNFAVNTVTADYHFIAWAKTDSRLAYSQWEMALLCNDVTYWPMWLGANLVTPMSLFSHADYSKELEMQKQSPKGIETPCDWILNWFRYMCI